MTHLVTIKACQPILKAEKHSYSYQCFFRGAEIPTEVKLLPPGANLGKDFYLWDNGKALTS